MLVTYWLLSKDGTIKTPHFEDLDVEWQLQWKDSPSICLNVLVIKQKLPLLTWVHVTWCFRLWLLITIRISSIFKQNVRNTLMLFMLCRPWKRLCFWTFWCCVFYVMSAHFYDYVRHSLYFIIILVCIVNRNNTVTFLKDANVCRKHFLRLMVYRWVTQTSFNATLFRTYVSVGVSFSHFEFSSRFASK